MDRRRVKPAPFEYVRPASVTEVVQALASDENAKVIAGGQSLVPLMAMRLARPSLLVDINDTQLDTVDTSGAVVRLGAGVRHRRMERDPALARVAPLLTEAAAQIGYPAIRTRGTIGGSLAHADPVAELPAVLLALGGAVVVHGPHGDRTIEAADLFTGFLSTTIAPDELLVEVRLPAAGARHGAAFCEWAPRSGDFAVAGIGVTVDLDSSGACVRVRAAACGVASVPVDCSDAFAPVVGAHACDDALLRSVAAGVRAGVGGANAELAGLLGARALLRAFSRAAGAGEVAA